MKKISPAIAGALALASASAGQPQRMISGEDLKGPNTDGRFPDGFTPRYLKKFIFDSKGQLLKEATINMVFKCTANSEASARKKFDKWKSKRVS